MRLNAYLARAGVASRRRSDELIRAGRVSVNGARGELNTVVGARDVVEVDGRRVSAQRVGYVLLHKPAGVVTTASDPGGRPTVVGLVEHEARVVPVGRLDADTTGALLLTNDGPLAHRLAHPRYGVPKVYEAEVEGSPGAEALATLREGVELDDGRTAPAEVRLLAPSLVELVLHEGRKHQVKRMLEAVGHPVRRLHRSRYAGLGVEGLEPGEWRELSAAEVPRATHRGRTVSVDATATESAFRRIGGESVLLLGAGRALLAQAAHPCVAAGIVRHSRYEQEPWRRLGRTMSAVYAVAFGTKEEADRAARQVRAVHGSVSGRLRESVGRFPAGTEYSALDPELATWVHATMVENALAMYELFVAPLTPADEEAFWRGMKAVAETFGVPRSALPPHAEDFRAYWREMLAGDVLAVGSDARRVANAVLGVRVPLPLLPARRAFHALTVTTLASELCALYGIRVSREDRLLAATAPALRGLLLLMPSGLRHVSDRRGRGGLPLRLLRALAG